MKRLLFLFFILILYISLITCNSLNDQDTATVTIDTGIRASKAAAPSDVTSISVAVSGEGMATMTKSIPVDTGIRTFDVPVGPARLFSVTAAAGNFIFLGSSTQDIPEDGEINIAINMIRQAGLLNLPNLDSYIGTTEHFSIVITIPETGGTVEYDFPPDDTSPKYVPTGSNRQISISAIPLLQSAVVSFSTETTTANFITGESTSVALPTVTETKILIPDYEFNFGAGRLVQIDDMTGNGWIERNSPYYTNIGTSYFRPRDIDFDSSGRIYITTYGTIAASTYVILRIDHMNDNTIDQIVGPGVTPVNAIAIDRNSNYIYHATDSALIRCDLDGSNPIPLLTGISFGEIRGLAVDDNGNLYIAAYIDSGERVIKYNPVTTDTILYQTDLLKPWDVIVKNDSLYVADYDDTDPRDSSKIIQLSLDLNYINQFGIAGSSPFYGPHRFLAILNNRFYLIDEDGEDPGEIERIIAFDNLGSTIDAFDPSMVGQSAFSFYSYC